jgi:hypothetical protein
MSQSVTTELCDDVAPYFGAGAAVSGAGAVTGSRPAYNKDRCFTLLVVDDQNTDW